jgi:hypothetical protein
MPLPDLEQTFRAKLSAADPPRQSFVAIGAISNGDPAASIADVDGGNHDKRLYKPADLLVG